MNYGYNTVKTISYRRRTSDGVFIPYNETGRQEGVLSNALLGYLQYEDDSVCHFFVWGVPSIHLKGDLTVLLHEENIRFYMARLVLLREVHLWQTSFAYWLTLGTEGSLV